MALPGCPQRKTLGAADRKADARDASPDYQLPTIGVGQQDTLCQTYCFEGPLRAANSDPHGDGPSADQLGECLGDSVDIVVDQDHVELRRCVHFLACLGQPRGHLLG